MTLELRIVVLALLLLVTPSLEAHAGWGRLTEEEKAVCAAPAPSEEARVVLVSTAGATVHSNNAIGSQDIETWTAGIEVEPGSEPLYVVLTARAPIIWRFTGALERLEHVVLASTATRKNESKQDRKPLVGATGVPGDRLTFVKSPGCFRPFVEVRSIDGAVTTARVRNAIGRRPDIVESFQRVGSVSLPTATMTTGQSNTTNVDPNMVIASLPAEPYELLPGRAGLAQLVEQGALSRVENDEYLIHRKIRFPPGLSAMSRLGFLLLRGVPEPEGDPGRACVVSEETGAPIGPRSGC